MGFFFMIFIVISWNMNGYEWYISFGVIKHGLLGHSSGTPEGILMNIPIAFSLLWLILDPNYPSYSHC